VSVTSVETPVRILIIDDNLQNREVAEGHLVAAGYQAIQAESGEQGLVLIEEQRPDLVLLDVLMPGLDGFETCRQIRMLPVVGDTPVLFLTALGDLGTHKQALDSGADDFLTKPINRTELLIRVRSLLRIKQLSDELKRNYDVIRAQHDALLGANRQKEELTALIVHDLKNPLSSILSNAQYVLGRKQLGVDECESLDDILRASQSMVRLVMNLLDVSRSEDGALIPHVTEFDLKELLAEVCKEMGRRLEDKNQKLQPLLAAVVEPVRADRDLIRRVIENLIDNAYKYGPRHTTITIELLPATMDDGAEPGAEIRVRDEGEGVPAPYRQLVFEKYGRVEGRAGAAARTSHGLGLVFCRRAVGVHGGAIWVEDGGGRGGCFCVRLPIRRLAVSSAVAAPPPLGAPRGGVAV
jgi:two-component system, sensor histidine kinase and response regulator